MVLKTEIILVNNPDSLNLIFGQSHFIKTVEDLHEVLVNAVPGIKFGLAFCEASGDRLIRTSGNSKEMMALAVKNAQAIGCGHSFIIFLENAFPINVLNSIKNVGEVTHIFCATSNPLQVVVAVSDQGRGVLGVIDGGVPKGVEKVADQKKRHDFIRQIGYKL